MNTVYLNQQYLPIDQALISVYDRAFLFGDSIYEVIPTYKGVLLGADLHLKRLKNSLREIFLEVELGTPDWQQIFNALLEKNNATNIDCTIYLQVTRGTYTPRKHAMPPEPEANILVMLQPFQAPSIEKLRQGYNAITSEDIRWHRCDIKTTSLLGNVLLLEKARHADCDDVIMLRNGIVTESSSSNVFIVHRNCIITPPATHYILNGVTRQIVLQLAKENQLDYVERDIHVTELEMANEIWLTSSTKEVVPVINLNQQPVGEGEPGPIWEKMIELYQTYRNNLSS